MKKPAPPKTKPKQRRKKAKPVKVVRTAPAAVTTTKRKPRKSTRKPHRQSPLSETLVRQLAARLLEEGDTFVATGDPQLDGKPVDPIIWPKLLKEAKKLVHTLADFDAKVEFLRAKERLEQVYQQGLVTMGGLGASVSAQKELNRLLSLFLPREQTTDDSELAAAVLTYLYPLKLGAETLPAAEHIRLAAQRIQNLSAVQGLKLVS